MKFEKKIEKQNELVKEVKSQVTQKLSKDDMVNTLENVYSWLKPDGNYAKEFAQNWFEKHVKYFKSNFDILFKLQQDGFDESSLDDDIEKEDLLFSLEDWVLIDDQLAYVKPDSQTLSTTEKMTIDVDFFLNKKINDLFYKD